MQFDEYLQQQLLAIDNLEERKIMRRIFESVLIPLQEYCDEKYISLAERIINEQEDSVQFTIYTGLTDRQKYDVTTENMLPMKKEDLVEKQVDLSMVKKSLTEENHAKMFRIYLGLSRSAIADLLSSERLFQGVITTDLGEFPAQFYLKQNQEYLQMIRDLYPVFVKNGVEWKTVCAPYLYKFFDVYVSKADDMAGEEIKEIRIDFEEYKEAVSYDLVPLWNLEVVSSSTNGYARPCVDQIHYEHMLFKERLGKEQYLVMNQEIEILNQRRVGGDMLITCNTSDNITWNLLKFHEVSDAKWSYPVMGNGCIQESKKAIRTKAAMEKLFFGLGYESYLNLKEIHTQKEPLQNLPAYHVDEEFLLDYMLKFTEGEVRNVLYFEFEAVNPQDIYTEDILSYLITRLQWTYPEYICIGKLK